MPFIYNAFSLLALYLITHYKPREMRCSKRREYIAYAFFYVIWSFTDLYFNSSAANIFFICLYVLSFLFFTDHLSFSLLAPIIVSLTQMALRSIVYTILIDLANIQMNLRLSIFVADVLLLAFVLLYIRIAVLWEQRLHTVNYAVPVFMILLANICIILFIYFISDIHVLTLATMLMLLCIDFSMIILSSGLYKKTMKLYEEKLLQDQVQAMSNQLQLIESSQKMYAKYRHDLKNQIIGLSYAIKNGNQEYIDNYIDETEKLITSHDSMINSGNPNLDAFLNFKLDILKHVGTELSCSVFIPQNLEFSSFHLITILGNLFDNASEALKKCKTKKLSFSIHYNKGMLFIKMANTYDKELTFLDNGLPETSKTGDGHGLGLSNIQDIVAKYDGLVRINTQNHIFTIMIMMYME